MMANVRFSIDMGRSVRRIHGRWLEIFCSLADLHQKLQLLSKSAIGKLDSIVIDEPQLFMKFFPFFNLSY